MSPDALVSRLPDPHTIVLVAPFYNRSGYGMGGRALAVAWHQMGLRVRILPVDEAEAGVDDFDLNLLKQLEQTPIVGALAVVFYHVPGPAWLEIPIAPTAARIMCTTFDSAVQGVPPPKPWIDVCNRMDQLWLMSPAEIPAWIEGGAEPSRIRHQSVPHPWIHNPGLPPVVPVRREGAFRFLCIAMYQPRRRWDTLIEAFLTAFREQPDVELVLKVNYPSWHPVPGQPERELKGMLAELQAKVPSRARVILDEDLGTRQGICRLLDSCDVYVSTDTATTAPVFEAMVRGRRVMVTESHLGSLPEGCFIGIPEDPELVMPLTDAMLAYQPHHRGRTMGLLKVEDVATALRRAYDETLSGPDPEWRKPWPGWTEWEAGMFPQAERDAYVLALEEVFRAKAAERPRVRWEGSQFVYHSLAHVNRQLCLGLAAGGKVDLSLVPYEVDQFDPLSQPGFLPLAQRVQAPLPGPADVHVRHQWPPRFDAPPEGAWVLVQPWEFGGIPKAWVEPIRRGVDEVWVPTSWVKDCYVQSGIPADRVQVIPHGVDCDLFTPEGPRYPLQTRKGTRFLFLGGTIARKGIDVLLEAYLKAFRAEDDICLVIKGQSAGVYGTVPLVEELARIRREDPGAPEIEYLDQGMDEAALASLYRSCEALVLPYRGEGFGLPILEAMASGLPVVVTGRGAAADFVTDGWGYLLPSEKRPIDRVDDFEPSVAGFWVEEPDGNRLQEVLRHVAAHPEEAREKGARGRHHAQTVMTWARAHALVLARIRALRERIPVRRLAPQAPVEPEREAFVHAPDWRTSEWVEVLMGYFLAFKPGDPVVLALRLDGTPGWTMGTEEAQGRILQVVQQAGFEVFPDLILVEHEAELAENLAGYEPVHMLTGPPDPGAAATVRLRRLQEARLQLRRS